MFYWNAKILLADEKVWEARETKKRAESEEQ
jgi:hypothetical protein